jgi:hypothetical protein
MAAPVTVTSFQVTGIHFSTTPRLAQLGAGELVITLTDPNTGWQEKINYKDTSVPMFWATATTAAASATVGDVIGQAVFQKLIADGNLPPGTLSTT